MELLVEQNFNKNSFNKVVNDRKRELERQRLQRSLDKNGGMSQSENMFDKSVSSVVQSANYFFIQLKLFNPAEMKRTIIYICFL